MTLSAEDAKNVAQILSDSLPYWQKFVGKVFVIKYGGSIMEDEALKKNFAQDIILLKALGIHPVVVHGGGTQLTKFLQRLNIKTQFVEGIRVTTAEILEIAQMVFGLVNAQIVALLNQNGGRSIGLNGGDDRMIEAVRMHIPVKQEGSEAPTSYEISKIKKINTKPLQLVIHNGLIPVVAPLGVDEKSSICNINADIVAAEVASALSAEKLIFLTNTEGIIDKNNQLLSELTRAQVHELIADTTIHGGMLPKTQSALDAMQKGVQSVHILDGRKIHVALLEIFTSQGIGTVISDTN